MDTKETKPANAMMDDALGAKAKYISPPSSMSAKEKKLFKELVRDYPPGYFRESDKPLLRMFVYWNCEAEKLIQDQVKVDELEDIAEKISLSAKVNRALGIASTHIGSLSTKLRLSVSSRIADTQVPKSIAPKLQQAKQRQQTSKRKKFTLVN